MAIAANSVQLKPPETLSDHLNWIRNEVKLLTERVVSIADRASGGIPRDTGGESPASAPSCHTFAFEIKSGLASLREEIDRLDRAI